MKDKKIRILCIVVAALSVLAIVPIMFEFYKYYFYDYYVNVNTYYYQYGFELYTNKEQWWYILIGVLGIISLLWNLVYGAYAIIDGRYRNLTWRIARYGYFYGIVVAVINFAVIMSTCCNSLPAAWVFLILVAAVAAIEVVLLLLKDEDTKSKLKELSENQ